MQLNKFQTQITYILIGSKFAVIGMVFLHFLQHKFNFAQTKELLFIILPLFTVYLTLVLKSLRGVGVVSSSNEGKQISGPLLFIGRWVPIVFALYMILVLIFQPAGTADSEIPFRQMKEMIGWGEAIFGVYIGYIVQATFQLTQIKENQNTDLLKTVKEIQSALQQKKGQASFENIQPNVLRDLIAKGKIAEAIEQLKNFISLSDDSKNLLNQVINLSAQYHQYLERRRLGLTMDDRISILVSNGLLEIIDELEIFKMD